MIVVNAKNFVISKLEQGYYTFSLNEAENAIGAGEKTEKALNRLAKQGWIISPSRGFFVIIDPQHQGKGHLPVEWFVDDWMKHLGGNYYIGILTAAMLHGASHQKPQQVQIIRDKEFRSINKGAYNISFYYKKVIPYECCEQRQSPAGYYKISSPEMTAYDILRYPSACPSINLAATVFQELGEKINSERLAALIETDAEIATLQRLGWLLDNTGWSEKTGLLSERFREKKMVWRLMRTDMVNNGPRELKWRVIANAEVEADI